MTELFTDAGLRVRSERIRGRPSAQVEGSSEEVSLGTLASAVGSLTARLTTRPATAFEDPWLSDLTRRAVEELARLQDDRAPIRVAAPWPEDRPSAFVLTHDVDVPRSLSDFSERRRVAMTLERGRRVVRPFSASHLRRVGQREVARGFRPTWFVLPVYGKVELARITACITPYGEVGLHSTGTSYRDLAGMTEQKRRVERLTGLAVEMLRTHALAFDHERTWAVASGAGFLVDASCGWNEVAGFRGGMCRPWLPDAFGFGGENLVEVPTPLMDWTFLARGLRGTEVIDAFRDGIRRTTIRGGLACLNVHNSYLDAWNNPGFTRGFDRLLSDVILEGVWCPSLSECVDWFQARRSFLQGMSVNLPSGLTTRILTPRGVA